VAVLGVAVPPWWSIAAPTVMRLALWMEGPHASRRRIVGNVVLVVVAGALVMIALMWLANQL
jgi:hypothetical protein